MTMSDLPPTNEPGAPGSPVPYIQPSNEPDPVPVSNTNRGGGIIGIGVIVAGLIVGGIASQDCGPGDARACVTRLDAHPVLMVAAVLIVVFGLAILTGLASKLWSRE